jgi:hypothetical protein
MRNHYGRDYQSGDKAIHSKFEAWVVGNLPKTSNTLFRVPPLEAGYTQANSVIAAKGGTLNLDPTLQDIG